MKKTIFISFILIWSFTPSFGQTNSLDYYVSQALARSPLLKDYQNQIQSNLVDSQRLRASYLPQVTAVSNNYYSPIIGGIGYDDAITNGAQVSALVGVTKSVVSKKNMSAQYASIRLQNQGLDNNARITEQDVKRTVIAQYITTYGSLQQLNFTKEIQDLLRKEESILKTLTEKNVYRQTDYLTFLVTLQQQELTLKQLSIQFMNDYAALNYLCGIVDTARQALAEPDINIQVLPAIDQSVFFHKYTIDSLQLANNKSLIDFSYKPRISLFADGGYNSSLAYRAYRNFGTTFGVNISFPIYDGKQKKMQYSKVDIAERTRQNYKVFYRSQYYQQVAQLTQQLKATESLIGDINHQIKYAEGLINVNNRLLETGDAKIADLIIALNNYLSAKYLLTQNMVSRLQIINQINYWNR